MRRRALHLLTGFGIVGTAACGNGANAPPTSPSGASVLALDVACPNELLIGERAPCVAIAHLSAGGTRLVSPESTWSTARPDVVAVDQLGTLTGRAAGEAVVSVAYESRNAAARVVVTARDGLRVKAAAEQGAFSPGSTVTMWLQGYYAVASADTGRLSLRITDQSATITQTPPTIVGRGGDFFLLSSTFVVPQDSTEVCRTAILEVSAVAIAEPQSNDSGLWCISIRR